MEAQNAQIGVAVAAYYPQVTLSALYGYIGSPLGSLISAANRIWSLGAAASETLFEGVPAPRPLLRPAPRPTKRSQITARRCSQPSRALRINSPHCAFWPNRRRLRTRRSRSRAGGADRVERVSGGHAALHHGHNRTKHVTRE